MMRLGKLVIENFRGLNERKSIDLSGDVVLFYGQNGRGKSSVLSALDLVLFPTEKVAELKREGGGQVPLTNRFNRGKHPDVGRISLTFNQGENSLVVTQEFTDNIDEIVPTECVDLRNIAGNRHRIFFTQRLLRDLIFGSSANRYERVKELLGCNAYDRLVAAIRNWHSEYEWKYQGFLDRTTRLREVYQELPSLVQDLGKMLPDGALRGITSSSMEKEAAKWFYMAIRQGLMSKEPELTPYCLSAKVPGSFSAVAQRYYNSLKRLQELKLALEGQLDGKSIEESAIKMPDSWRSHFVALAGKTKSDYDDYRNRRTELQNALLREGAAGSHESLHVPLQVDPNAVSSEVHELQAEFQEAEARYQYAVNDAANILRLYQVKTDRLYSRIKKYLEAAQKLRRVEDGIFALERDKVATPDEGANMLNRRNQLQTFARCLFTALLQLEQEELQRRADELKPHWNRYYGQITSYSHFQEISIDTFIEEQTFSARMFRIPRSESGFGLRFMVGDSADRAIGEKFPMEALLSEGQLNCAVVSLALSLCELGSTPLKVIVLDDPFVSWDDVNMENFFRAVRHLSSQGWTLLLSTCDPRAVTSLRKNMETVHDNNSCIVTFKDWDRERGPVVERTQIGRKGTKNLSELPAEIFQGVEV